jgi:outer membrane lipase/esterase
MIAVKHTNHRRLGALCAGLVAVTLLTGATSAAAFDRVVVFGDSLSDVGNDFIATKGAEPAAPYVAGRFSDGPVWIENVAASYGFVLKPSLGGGSDYAYGGAETTADVSSNFGTIPSLQTQAATYLTANHGKADPSALFVIWGGSNDLLNTVEGNPGALPGLPAQFASATKRIIKAIYLAGGRSFLVPQVPDIGLSPEALALGSTVSSAASDAAKAMNLALATVLVEEELNGRTIYHLHAFKVQDELTAAANLGAAGGNAGAESYFNLSNVADACLNGTTVCAQPNHFFYWDGLHPTAVVHAALGVAAITALPH